MTVNELIQILQTIENPDAEIKLNDTAAGTIGINEVENVFDMYYLIHPIPSKRSKGKR